MAEAKKTEKASQERVDIYIERAMGNDEPNMFVSVNGVNYVLPKGKTSSVPKHVADEIERSRKAQRMLDENIDRLLKAAQ